MKKLGEVGTNKSAPKSVPIILTNHNPHDSLGEIEGEKINLTKKGKKFFKTKKDEITSYKYPIMPAIEGMRRGERMTTMKYDIDNSKDKEYRIRSHGMYYIVDKYVDENYGLFFIKTRKVWKPLCIFGTPIVGSLSAILFRSKNEARKFIEGLKNEENENSIEYL